MIGATGSDENAALLRAAMAEVAGLDTSAVASLATAPTGEAMIQRDAAGENSIIVSPGANAQFTSAEVAQQGLTHLHHAPNLLGNRLFADELSCGTPEYSLVRR